MESLNTDGGPRNDFWGKIWERVIRLRGKQYRLPGGALGRKFTSIYSDEINALARGEKKSEISVCFAPLMLQKDKNVKTTKDIRRLIHRRIEMWLEQKFDLLIQEAEKCDKNFQGVVQILLMNASNKNLFSSYVGHGRQNMGSNSIYYGERRK